MTRATNSHFTWDYGKHECHFQHGDSILPELWLYKGTSYFSAFCSRLRGYLNDNVSYAFSSAFSHLPEINLPLTSADALVNEGDDNYGITYWYHPDDQFKIAPAKKESFTIGTNKSAEDTLPAPNNEFEFGKNLV